MASKYCCATSFSFTKVIFVMFLKHVLAKSMQHSVFQGIILLRKETELDSVKGIARNIVCRQRPPYEEVLKCCM